MAPSRQTCTVTITIFFEGIVIFLLFLCESFLAAGAGFAAAFSNVEQALQLSPMGHAEAMGLEAWEVAGNSGTIAGYQGKKVLRKK